MVSTCCICVDRKVQFKEYVVYYFFWYVSRKPTGHASALLILRRNKHIIEISFTARHIGQSQGIGIIVYHNCHRQEARVILQRYVYDHIFGPSVGADIFHFKCAGPLILVRLRFASAAKQQDSTHRKKQ